MAVWALVASLAAPVLWLLSMGLSGSAFGRMGGNPVFSGLSLLAIAGPIAGLTLGMIVRRDPRSSQASRNLALAAIIISCIMLGLIVLYILLAFLLILLCIQACSSSRAETQAAALLAAGAAMTPGCPAMAGAATPWAPPGTHRRWTDALAHHPDLPCFHADVYHIRGLRLCVGCFTAWPAFAASLPLAFFSGLPWATLLGLGLALGTAQIISTMGLTKWRWLKATVKGCVGIGAACAIVGLEAAPWPRLAKSIVAMALVGILMLSTIPRQRRIKAAVAAS